MTANPTSAGLGVEFREIDKRYGALMALRGVSFRIEPGERVALLGPNGSGKTTLLRIASQLSRPSRGQVRFFSGAQELSAQAVRPRLAMVAHQTMAYDELTAYENLHFFGKLYGIPDAAAHARAALEPAGLSARAGDSVRTFSRGMRQRLSIARALLPSPNLLLCDEPATGLDAEGNSWLLKTLQRLSAGGCTILISTHEPEALHDVITRTIRLERGAISQDSGAGAARRELTNTPRAKHSTPTVMG